MSPPMTGDLQSAKLVGSRPPGGCVGDRRHGVLCAEYHTLPPGGTSCQQYLNTPLCNSRVRRGCFFSSKWCRMNEQEFFSTSRIVQCSFRATGLPSSPPLRLAVIGGGLAGIAAAEAAKRLGYDVDLFEWSRTLGGRATSMLEPTTGQWIDNGQHVVLGCCTELLTLNRRFGLERFFEHQANITFASLEGKRWTMIPSPFLPLRWQLVPAFLKLPFLTFRDRLSTGLLLRKLPKVKPHLTEISFGQWLNAENASEESVKRFWEPLIFSTLSETVESVGFSAAQKVVRDGFLSGPDAMTLYVPTQPLRSIYHEATVDYLNDLGVRSHFLSRVVQFQWTDGMDGDEKARILAIVLADGTVRSFDRYILAIPSFRVWKLFEESGLENFAEQLDLGRFEPGAITTAHCWFDRRILPSSWQQAALIGGPAQFVFCPRRESTENGVYHTAVISASHRLLSDLELTSNGTATLLDRIVRQIQTTFPESFREPNELRHGRTTTVFNAVFSPNPNVYASRPAQATPFANLTLAGDWTDTGWPATMEGAVRSGIAAAKVLGSEE